MFNKLQKQIYEFRTGKKFKEYTDTIQENNIMEMEYEDRMWNKFWILERFLEQVGIFDKDRGTDHYLREYRFKIPPVFFFYRYYMLFGGREKIIW